jgi:hypothetical protein
MISDPRLDGARKVYFRLTNPQHADLDRNIRQVETAWAKARKALASAGGLCHCGNRWGHLMNGVEVTLLDRSPYTARCWDDDRVWINLPFFAEETDGGVGALVHEFGHRVWFQCLSQEQQDQWTRSWNEARKRPTPRWTGECSGTISGYACTSDLEDFAEVFKAVVMGEVDPYNRKRWVEVCGCGKGEVCERPHTAAPSANQSANLSRAPRGPAPILWKTPGDTAAIGRTPGGGPWTQSQDERFVIWVKSHGDRLLFSALDYGIPDETRAYTILRVDRSRHSSPDMKKVLAAVERWAHEHPA